MKDYNVMTDERFISDEPVNNDLRTYHTIKRITTGKGDWLHNWLFTKLPLFQKLLNCNRFK